MVKDDKYKAIADEFTRLLDRLDAARDREARIVGLIGSELYAGLSRVIQDRYPDTWYGELFRDIEERELVAANVLTAYKASNAGNLPGIETVRKVLQAQQGFNEAQSDLRKAEEQFGVSGDAYLIARRFGTPALSLCPRCEKIVTNRWAVSCPHCGARRNRSKEWFGGLAIGLVFAVPVLVFSYLISIGPVVNLILKLFGLPAFGREELWFGDFFAAAMGTLVCVVLTSGFLSDRWGTRM